VHRSIGGRKNCGDVVRIVAVPSWNECDFDEWDRTNGSACATIIPGEPEPDIVERLRDVVEEVTGKPVDRPVRRIGFL
jgi:hypothetical protein